MLRINYIDYSPATRSLDLFVAGCFVPLCKNCCNPELADFHNGTEWHSWKDQIEKYLLFDSLISNIFLLGGSFNHQKEEDLKDFIPYIKKFNKKIWLFAREDLNEVQSIFKDLCDFIKCGEYVPELSCLNNIQYGVSLATSNQKIYQKGKNF